MALVLEANYSKKLGLPGYSSHQYSLTVRIELSDIKQVETESKRLYTLLQSCADRELRVVGFLPGPAHNGNGAHPANGNGHSAPGHGNGDGHAEEWKCSVKQRDLILKLVEEHRIPKAEVERLSVELFGAGVKNLNKLQASGLIGELTAEQGKQPVPGRSTAPRATTGGRR